MVSPLSKAIVRRTYKKTQPIFTLIMQLICEKMYLVILKYALKSLLKYVFQAFRSGPFPASSKISIDFIYSDILSIIAHFEIPKPHSR